MTAAIALKNVKSWTGQEGIGYQATIYVDGVKAAMVTDDAHGGELRWDIRDEAAMAKLQAAADISEFKGIEDLLVTKDINARTRLDLFAAALVDAHENDRRLRRHMKTKTLFRLPTDEKDAYRTINRPFDPAVKAHILKKYPNATILNEKG